MAKPSQHEKQVDTTKRDGSARSTPAGQTVRARIVRPHKGDVGRPETNEEIFQGSKERELH
jgi:hypothetical protein